MHGCFSFMGRNELPECLPLGLNIFCKCDVTMVLGRKGPAHGINHYIYPVLSPVVVGSQVGFFVFLHVKLPDKHIWPTKALPKTRVFLKNVLALKGDDNPDGRESKGDRSGRVMDQFVWDQHSIAYRVNFSDVHAKYSLWHRINNKHHVLIQHALQQTRQEDKSL